MTEPIFLQHGPGLTVGEIAKLTGATPRADAPADYRIHGIASLILASPRDASFIDNKKYLDHLAATRAGLCFASERFEKQIPAGVAVLVTNHPYAALVAVATALFPAALRPSSLFEAQGRTDGALVHETARIESGVIIDPGAVIGPRAEIGTGTTIGSNAVIGPDVRIGRNCSIGAGASVTHALIGDRVTIHPGCRIGQDGFGYLPGLKGHRKIPQVGRVIIQDDVDLGANSTVDRGGLRDTVIGEGTKIDNLVQIAHNVSIGRHCLIAAQVGVSGSSTVGDYVMLGGQAGLADNIVIGEGAQIAARAGLMRDVPPGERWGGTPGRPAREWLRVEAMLTRMLKRGAGTVPKEADE
jgi:UDP-3-O-[3-hydroxymyristoyl] glucosamine N-acyltransferase